MRNKRILLKNADYHVTARSNRQEFIFEQKFIKEMFMSVLLEARIKFNFKIKNFCIMSNHIHLIIKPSDGTSLSKIMQWILSKFAVKFNKYYGLKGHVWYDRFKSKIIENFIQFLNVYNYIVNNPVRAGLVNNPDEYFYSGINYRNKKNCEIIDPL